MAAVKPVSIPEPQKNINSMFETILALKQQVEILSGQKGPRAARAPSYQELVDMGLIQSDQIP